MRPLSWWSVLAGHVSLAILLAWPLPAHLFDALPGQVSGDTGVYVWNLWVFAHELLAGGSPFATRTILTLTPPIDLSLHNYTVLLDLLALPLLPVLGLVGSYNAMYLGLGVATALATFAVVFRLTRHAPASWLAGALFAWSPVLVARSTGHMSLVAATPLPLFVLGIVRWLDEPRPRHSALAGLAFAAAVFCDPYYAVYCVLLAVVLVVPRVMAFARRPAPLSRRATLALDTAIAILGALVAAIHVSGGWVITANGVHLSVLTAHNPGLVLVGLVCVRIAVSLTWRRTGQHMLARVVGLRTAASFLGCALLPTSPWIHALIGRLTSDGTLSERTFWRSSPDGVDLLALIAPNPNHPLLGQWTHGWLDQLTGRFIENTASIPWVALIVLAVAVLWARVRLPRAWVWATATFLLLSLGPFIHVAGFNTQIPGPWALLRYVPILASARAPTRFAIPLMLGVSVLFGFALTALLRRSARPRWVFFGVAGALLFEVCPAPRTLYEAGAPSIYETIAADPRDMTVLHLPFGMRDGVRNQGAYSTETQYYQTFHGKRLVGGYLSRVRQSKFKAQRRYRNLRYLLLLGEGREMPLPRPEIIRLRGAGFVERAKLGYVVIDPARTPLAAAEFARVAFDLEWIGEGDGLQLYRPRPSTPSFAPH